MSSLGLLDLANQHFDVLTDPERHFLKSVRAGKEDRIESSPGTNTPATRRILRSEIIRWLCTNEQAKKLVDPFGIQIDFAEITALPDSGKESILNFSSLILNFPLVFKNCVLPPKILMQGMESTFLSFENSQVGSIEADVIRIKGDFYLRGGNFSSNGFVKFPGASIGGDLDCSGARFNNSPAPPLANQPLDPNNGIALDARGISVGGDVLLGKAVVKGRLLLEGANLQGDLDCTDAQFLNPYQHPLRESGLALEADHLSVKGSLSLKKSKDAPKGAFLAQGKIRLLAAHIGGQLVCSGAMFENPKDDRDDREQTGDVLSAEGIEVQGQVFLRTGFSANGKVHLEGATIGGHLFCKDASFTTLSLASASVSRGFVWKGITYSGTADLDFRNLSVVALEDDLASWPQNGTYSLDGFTYGHITDGCGPAENRITWIARQSPFAPQPYRQLAKVLRDDGDVSGARNVLYEMEKLRDEREMNNRRSQILLPQASFRVWLLKVWISLIRIWQWILRLTVGYGYYPQRALLCLLVLTLAGGFVYWLAYDLGMMRPTDILAYQSFQHEGYPPAHYQRFHAFVYSLANTFPVINIGKTESWQPDQDPSAPVPPGVFLYFLRRRLTYPALLTVFRYAQIFFGWILTTLGVAAITGLTHKE